MTRIKICGVTNAEDARAAIDAGADALGFVFAASPRRVDPAAAEAIVRTLPPFVVTVGVFMDAAIEDVSRIATAARLDQVQLHGEESPHYCRKLAGRVIKRLDVRDDDTPETLSARADGYAVSALLLDPGAGSGRTFDWALATDFAQHLRERGPTSPRLILSGGLTPENVAEAVRRVRPYAVDVSSGVERAPGQKDAQRMRAFVQAVRESDDAAAG